MTAMQDLPPDVQQELERLRRMVNNFDLQRMRNWYIAVQDRDPIARHFLAHCATLGPFSHGQLMQDLFVDFVLAREAGCFVEFGATNGVEMSNTLFLERRRGWSGLLAEPGKNWHAALTANRPTCKIDTRCVWRTTGEHLPFNETVIGELSTIEKFTGADFNSEIRETNNRYQVESVSLNDLLDDHLPGADLDYLSIDTEGSELDILETFDVDARRPKILTLEHNFTDQRDRIFEILTGKDFVRVLEILSLFDDWYVDREIWAQVQARYTGAI